MSNDPTSEVRAFFEATAMPGNLMAAMDAHLSPDIVWENSGLPTAEGMDAAKAFMQQFIDALGMQALEVELRAVAADGGSVLTERIDYFLDGDGKRLGSVAVSGVLDVRDGRIVAWRDYFDPRPFIPGS